jgi:hypothetical protein
MVGKGLKYFLIYDLVELKTNFDSFAGNMIYYFLKLFFVLLKIFHSYWNITIAGEGVQKTIEPKLNDLALSMG